MRMMPFFCTLVLANCLSSRADVVLVRSLSTRMVQMNCPGALVGVFPDEGTPTRYALGVADVKAKQPMMLDMHMRVGSVTKPFLGTVVLQLASEGKLSLDDPISKYVDGAPKGERITLRMLGNNTSGLFNTIENKEFQYAIMRDPPYQWKIDEILKYTWAHDSYFPPGERFRYSNTNAVLLGMVIEKVTGKPFAKVIAERVWEPLKLAQTGVLTAGELPAPHPSAYRHGYPDKVIGYGTVFYDVSNYSASWTNAAGNMYSTLDDLGRACKPIVTGELLNEAGKKELQHWQDVGRENYEYGFCLGKRGNGIGHWGDVPGYNASFTYYPASRQAVIVLTNLSNNADGTMPAEELAKVVVECLGIK